MFVSTGIHIIAGSAAKIAKYALWHIQSTIKLLDANLNLDTILDTVFPWIYSDSFLEDKNKVLSEIKRIKEDPTPQSYAGYVGQTKAIADFDLINKLSDSAVPTLIISGSDDVLITKELSKSQLYEKIPAAQFQILEHCGHMFHREKPKEFAKMILDFAKTS